MSSLIDQQRATIAAEIQTARQSARRAAQSVEAERSKYLWSKKNPTFALDANLFILENYLNAAGILVSEDSLDLAFRACRNQLAERAPEAPEPTAQERQLAENARLQSLSPDDLRAEIRAGINRKLATPEYGGHGAVYVPDFSAQEFLKFSPTRVKEIMHYPGSNQERPGVRAGIDKLLRDAQLLKNATN